MLLSGRTRIASALVVCFEFKRGMMDMELLTEALLELLLDQCPAIQLPGSDDDVSLDSPVVLVNFPQMDVVNVSDSRHPSQFCDEIGRFYIRGSSLHKYVNRAPNIGKTLSQNEYGDNCCNQ